MYVYFAFIPNALVLSLSNFCVFIVLIFVFRVNSFNYECHTTVDILHPPLLLVNANKPSAAFGKRSINLVCNNLTSAKTREKGREKEN